MVVSDHNQPVQRNGIALLGNKVKASYIRATVIEKSLCGHYMGYMCYWLNEGVIPYWVSLSRIV